MAHKKKTGGKKMMAYGGKKDGGKKGMKMPKGKGSKYGKKG